MINFAWRNKLSTIIDLILPAKCLACQCRGYYLCPDCLALLPPAPPTELENIEALFDYQDRRISQAIWRLKYRGGRAIARDLGQALYERLLENLAEWQLWHPGAESRWLVVPIPLSRARLRKRGFNQARELARALVTRDHEHLELTDQVLLKQRETPSQMQTRDRLTRLNNLRGAFTVNQPESVAGKNILLVDDVITTGATMKEARDTLTRAGAKSIFGMALAHG